MTVTGAGGIADGSPGCAPAGRDLGDPAPPPPPPTPGPLAPPGPTASPRPPGPADINESITRRARAQEKFFRSGAPARCVIAVEPRAARHHQSRTGFADRIAGRFVCIGR